MSHRRLIVTALALGMLLSACKKDPPPPPAPTGPTQEEMDRMRADSIRAAQEEARRIEEERRQQEAEEARRLAVAEARASLTEMVFFDFDESELTMAAEAVLRVKVDILRASPMVQLRLEGHTDERGSTEYNLALGNRRAEAVRQFFASFGLDESRFTTISYGEERPRARESNEDAWAQNRRVEFVITAGANQINPPGVGQKERGSTPLPTRVVADHDDPPLLRICTPDSWNRISEEGSIGCPSSRVGAVCGLRDQEGPQASL